MALFEPGKKFPDDESIERLAKYKRMAMIFDGKSFETYKRAVDILRKSGKREQADQLEALFTEITIIETLITKPADMLVGEKPTYDAKHDADAVGRKKVDEIAQNNDLDKLVHELVIGGGIRGDSWIKVRYGYRQDFTELLERALPIPQSAKLEPIIEHVFAPDVYPEVAPNNVKQFSAVNIAKVDEVSTGGILPKKEYYLDVERHLHGYIIRDRFRLKPSSANKEYGVAVATYLIGDRVQETQIEETGVDYMCVYHIPHKSLDDRWQGVGGIEKVEGIIRAIQDRFMQIDYILWKHSDPAMYAPPSDASELTHSSSGVIFEVEKDDITPGYMTWNSQLEGAFRQLDYYIGLLYQKLETPDWLFGTSVIGKGNNAGGTSHTGNAGIKSRYLPITSKVKRIRVNVDFALRNAIWLAQHMEVYANEGVEDFVDYTPVSPVIKWKDGVPRDEKEDAEIAAIRTDGRPTLDQSRAIKRLDGVNDEEADAILAAIESDEVREAPPVASPSVFRQFDAVPEEVDDDAEGG